MRWTTCSANLSLIALLALGMSLGCSDAFGPSPSPTFSSNDDSPQSTEVEDDVGDEEAPDQDEGAETYTVGERIEDGSDCDHDDHDHDPKEVDGNMLSNPSFEAGAAADGCPEEWACRTYPDNAGTFSADDRHVFRGDYAAHWYGDENQLAEDPIALFSQQYRSDPGREYDISVWYRSEGLDTAPGVHVLFYDSNQNHIDDEFFAGDRDTGDWDKIEAQTMEAPRETAYVRFNLSVAHTAGAISWDEAVLVDVSDSDVGDRDGDGSSGNTDPADYETIKASGQTISLSDGEVFENKLIDLTTGGDITISTTNATNWTIRNVGIKGRKQTSGTLFGVGDVKGGKSVMENIYMADGSGRNGGQATCSQTQGCTHGPVGIWVTPEHSGHLDFKHINVQGWPNNGIYGSAPGSNGNGKRGTIHIDQSFSKNNYVAGFRIAGDERNKITNSVAYNDGNDYNGRPLWIWKTGPVQVENVHLQAGGYSYALVAGAWSGSTVVDLKNSQVRGDMQEADGSTIRAQNVGNSPDLTPPDGVPMSAEEAASGRAGH